MSFSRVLATDIALPWVFELTSQRDGTQTQAWPIEEVNAKAPLM